MTSPSGSPQGAGANSGPGAAQGFPPGPQQSAPPAGGLQGEVHTLERAIFEVKRIIVGQDLLVERMLVGLLAKGHVLLEGVPGVAKTLAVETFAKLADAVTATKSLDDAKLAEYMHQTTFNTVVGDVKFRPDGEWAKSRVVQIQFHDISGNGLEQFRNAESVETIVTPDDYKTGDLIYPYNAAKQAAAH